MAGKTYTFTAIGATAASARNAVLAAKRTFTNATGSIAQRARFTPAYMTAGGMIVTQAMSTSFGPLGVLIAESCLANGAGHTARLAAGYATGGTLGGQGR